MRRVWQTLGILVLLSVLISACSGANAPVTVTPVKGASATDAAPAGKLVTSSGFVCPEAQDKTPVTSKELNLFVWTEYIPQDMIDCFQLVYNIKINRDEYSSNEDMYAKLAAG